MFVVSFSSQWAQHLTQRIIYKWAQIYTGVLPWFSEENFIYIRSLINSVGFLLLWPFTRIIILKKKEISWVCEVLTGTERVCVKIPTLCYINKHEMKTAVQRHSLLCWWWPNILKLPAVNLGWNITIKHTMCDYKHFVGAVNPCVQ